MHSSHFWTTSASNLEVHTHSKAKSDSVHYSCIKLSWTVISTATVS